MAFGEEVPDLADPQVCVYCGEPYVAGIVSELSDLEPDGEGGMVAYVDARPAEHRPCPVAG